MEFMFGKYEGVPVEEVCQLHPDYIYWLLRQEWFADKYPDVYDEIISLGYSDE